MAFIVLTAVYCMNVSTPCFKLLGEVYLQQRELAWQKKMVKWKSGGRLEGEQSSCRNSKRELIYSYSLINVMQIIRL